jgi:hypothetical protein
MHWPDSIEAILGGDQAMAFGYVTPASGVVLAPLTNIGLSDRSSATVTPVSSSVGAFKKLERIQQNPRVALAYHTREHGFSDGPEYVLLQGRARLSPVEDRTWVERHIENWEHFAGPRDVGPLWERWMSAYHWRVGITVDVERVVAWPDLACSGPPTTYGAPLPPDPPPPQRPPRNGTGPRVNHRRAARQAARLPNVLLAWVGADGFPVIAPVRIGEATAGGIALAPPAGLAPPPGGRRAGVLAHRFAKYTYGQHQRSHTGWLTSDGSSVLYAPHTKHGYYMPWSRFAYRLSAGAATQVGLRRARKAGFVAR